MITDASIITICTYGSTLGSFLGGNWPLPVYQWALDLWAGLYLEIWWSTVSFHFGGQCQELFFLFSDSANQTTSQSAAHLIFLLETAWYISYYHRFLHCHPGLLLVMVIMFILPDGQILPSGLYQSIISNPHRYSVVWISAIISHCPQKKKKQNKDNPCQISQICLYSSFFIKWKQYP